VRVRACAKSEIRYECLLANEGKSPRSTRAQRHKRNQHSHWRQKDHFGADIFRIYARRCLRGEKGAGESHFLCADSPTHSPSPSTARIKMRPHTPLAKRICGGKGAIGDVLLDLAGESAAAGHRTLSALFPFQILHGEKNKGIRESTRAKAKALPERRRKMKRGKRAKMTLIPREGKRRGGNETNSSRGAGWKNKLQKREPEKDVRVVSAAAGRDPFSGSLARGGERRLSRVLMGPASFFFPFSSHIFLLSLSLFPGRLLAPISVKSRCRPSTEEKLFFLPFLAEAE